MNVGQYHYYHSYLINLQKYHSENVKEMSIKDRMNICTEIYRLKDMFK